MLTFNHFWLFALLFVFAVFIVIAAAIWQTRPMIPDTTSSNSMPKMKVPTHVPKSAEIRQAIAAKPDLSYPTSKKKMHPLVTDETCSLTRQALNQKIEALDKQLQALNSQLQAQGFVLPESQSNSLKPSRRLQTTRPDMKNDEL